MRRVASAERLQGAGRGAAEVGWLLDGEHVGGAEVVFGLRAEMEIEADRFAEVGLEVAADRVSGDAADDLADQEALGVGVIAMTVAQRPPGFLFGQGGGHQIPVEERSGWEWSANGGEAALVGQDPAEGDVGLAVLGELGPIVGDFAVDFQLASLGHAPGEDGANGFADGIAADKCVLGPGPGVFGVGPAAVEVDH